MKQMQRFWKKVRVRDDSCWEWLAHISPEGYGRFTFNRSFGYAHRFAYETFIGHIPSGMDIDHLCQNKWCVNPNHLEPVSRQTNAQRGNTGIHQRMKTHCPKGHPYDEQNTYRPPGKQQRQCRACANDRSRARAAKQRSLQGQGD
ncbi:MAG: HNH endonuclease [Chloroflexi bacterium]|nr:HNH endonuclease [Chloroflexota bacterium]